jgi:hypothetical protein
MFSEENLRSGGLTKIDQAGEYFIDRNGRYFECILDFYRCGQVFVPSTVPVAAIREEISFFQLPVDERQLIVHGEMWGDRIAKIAISRAMDNGRPALEKIMEHVTNALNAAADKGCWRTTIDICRTTAYVRTSGGIVKKDPRLSLASMASLPPLGSDDTTETHEAKASAPEWHYNVVDAAITKWLGNTDNRRLLESHLLRENFKFSFKRELSFFVLTFHLFDLPQFASGMASLVSSSTHNHSPLSSSSHVLSTSPENTY